MGVSFNISINNTIALTACLLFTDFSTLLFLCLSHKCCQSNSSFSDALTSMTGAP